MSKWPVWSSDVAVRCRLCEALAKNESISSRTIATWTGTFRSPPRSLSGGKSFMPMEYTRVPDVIGGNWVTLFESRLLLVDSDRSAAPAWCNAPGSSPCAGRVNCSHSWWGVRPVVQCLSPEGLVWPCKRSFCFHTSFGTAVRALAPHHPMPVQSAELVLCGTTVVQSPQPTRQALL